jgi:hypothetical protein
MKSGFGKWFLGFCLALALGTTAQAGSTSGIGIGPIIGLPTGISAKIWQGRTNAIDGIVGWSFRGDYLELVADYVWHNYTLIPVSSGKFPIYYGLGGIVHIANDPGMGIRMVGGMEYLFPSAPLDLFMEVAPVAGIFPEPGIGVCAGIGMRYFF